MSPLDRAKAAHAAAEAADHPRDKAAWKVAAALWERIAGPGQAPFYKALQADLRQLRIDVVVARGPFQPPQPPKAPSPAAQPLIEELRAAGGPAARELAARLEVATIEF